MHFLLVEDDDDHAELVIDIFEYDADDETIDRVADGVDALAYLRRDGEYSDRQKPDVILLDINLPRLSGLEVLEKIKDDPKLGVIPVVMLTTSEADSDRIQAYSKHVNSYVVKPIDFEKMKVVVQNIRTYWTQCNSPAPE